MKKYNGPLPSLVDILFQLTDGLNYIHGKKFVHRDIKPENILISASQPVRMIWSDFGSSKPTKSGTFSMSGIRGTHQWIPPEFVEHYGKEHPAGDSRPSGQDLSDIFSLGCVFFYIVKEGLHPFGDLSSYLKNIQEGNPVNMNGKLKPSTP